VTEFVSATEKENSERMVPCKGSLRVSTGRGGINGEATSAALQGAVKSPRIARRTCEKLTEGRAESRTEQFDSS
jgi:hypothetical protein